MGFYPDIFETNTGPIDKRLPGIMLDRIIGSPTANESNCGANAPGGGGFQKGNTCAKGGGGRKVKKVKTEPSKFYEKYKGLVKAAAATSIVAGLGAATYLAYRYHTHYKYQSNPGLSKSDRNVLDRVSRRRGLGQLPAEELNRLREHFVSKQKLTEQDVSDLYNYYLSGSYLINHKLRKGNLKPNDYVSLEVSKLDSIINKQPAFESPITVYRGMHYDPKITSKEFRKAVAEVVAKAGTGEKHTFKEYLSTTLDRSMAKQFAYDSPFKAGTLERREGVIPVVFRIKANKGLVVPHTKAFGHEFEVLLPRNSSFVVDRAREYKDRLVVDLTMVD